MYQKIIASISKLITTASSRSLITTANQKCSTVSNNSKHSEEQQQRQRRKKYPVSVSRHYYSTSKEFEKSLDIYKPILYQNSNDDDHHHIPNEPQHEESLSSLPLVVLVVGSSWVGHHPIIYRGTSWWNSSCGQTVAELGNCVCVIIRHRSSFPRLILPGAGTEIPIHISSTFIVLVATLITLVLSIQCGINCQDVASLYHHHKVVVVVACITLLWVNFLYSAGQHAATFDMMLDDVAEALRWVNTNRNHEILMVDRPKTKKVDGKNRQHQHRPLIFGGYSSGGHVAATLLLQSPDFFQERGLPADQESFIDGVLLLSGVLGVRRLRDTHSSIVPSQRQQKPTGLVKSLSASSPSISTWMINFVLHVVFGQAGSESLPSPLHALISKAATQDSLTSRSRELPHQSPHLLIGCTNEVFGIPWLDLFFCSKDYSRVLDAHNVPVRYIEVSSNHWNILASDDLSTALETCLPWLLKQQCTNQR